MDIETDKITYQMPQDWNLIQEALGVEVVPDYVKRNHDGDILKVARLSSDGKGYIPENSNVMFIGIKTCKPSTKEAYEAQEAKKKECASVASGIIKSVVDSFKTWRDFEKQMEAVKSISDHQKEMSTSKIKEFVESCKKLGSTSKGSTFGEYPIKQIFNHSLQYPCCIGVDLASKESDHAAINIIRTDNVTPLYDRIKELEISNNELKVEIESRDQRITFLENLITKVRSKLSEAD